MLIPPDAQMFFEHDEGCSCLADSGCDVSVCASLLVNYDSQVDERLHLLDGLSTNLFVLRSKKFNFEHYENFSTDLSIPATLIGFNNLNVLSTFSG